MFKFHFGSPATPRESSRPGQEGKEHGPLWTTQIHRPRIGPAGQIKWSLFQSFQCGEKKATDTRVKCVAGNRRNCLNALTPRCQRSQNTQGSRINSARRWLTSALRRPLQTSCHIWCSAQPASAHCGRADMAADLGSGQIALPGVLAR